MSEFDFSFKHPTTIKVYGPARCGKTKLVLRILEHELIQPSPTQIVCVYAEDQPDYKKAAEINPNIEFIRGWKDKRYDQFMTDVRNLLIVDDQMDEPGRS